MVTTTVLRTAEDTAADNMDVQTGEPVILTIREGEPSGAHESVAVLIPGGAWFLRAEFSRDGADLVLTGPEGQHVIIEGYFEASAPSALTAGNGVTLKGDVVASLAGPLAPGQYAADSIDGLDSLAQLGEPIGTIETLSGTVEVTRADGTRETLGPGDLVYQGDFVETASDGSLGVVFLDQSTFSLGGDGRITFDEMVYSPEDQSGAATMSLLQGTFSFVSGSIARADPDAMTIDTPTATIGIRGTGGGGNLRGNGELTIAVLEETGGITGEIVVANDQGSTIINQPNTGVNVEPGTAPTVPIAFSGQQLGQVFGTALLSLPNVAEAFTPEVLNEIRSGISGVEQDQPTPSFTDVEAPVLATFATEEDEAESPVIPQPKATLDTADDGAGDLAALADAAKNRALELLDGIQDYIKTFTSTDDDAPPAESTDDTSEAGGGLSGTTSYVPLSDFIPSVGPSPQEPLGGLEGTDDASTSVSVVRGNTGTGATDTEETLGSAFGTNDITGNDVKLEGSDAADTFGLVVRAEEEILPFMGNHITLDGGGGDDIFNVSITGVEDRGDNTLVLNGGTGADAFNLNVDDLDTAITFRYDSVFDGGDTIIGLNTDDEFRMDFDMDTFEPADTTTFRTGGNADESGLEQTVLWFYNEDTATLQYDSDGFNNGGNEAETIATFRNTDGTAQDVGLTLDHIIFTSGDDDPTGMS